MPEIVRINDRHIERVAAGLVTLASNHNVYDYVNRGDVKRNFRLTGCYYRCHLLQTDGG
jgi:hypothetical protein